MTTTETELLTITVDGKQITARPGELLIEACERAGVFIPRFCWHKRMDPVGACRMCLVDVEGSPPIPGTDQRRPQTSCTTVVREGMVVHTQYTSPEINDAQKTILELLLINHPLDCPICDRGGECPLQDQVQDYGPNESRFTDAKRRYEKAVKISPLVNLDRERCILCYRCTRFCEELSGDVLIGVMERGPRAFIFPYYAEPEGNGHGHGPGNVQGPSGSDINQTFDSYFSGNTIQICPVGALTSSEYRFMARPWDMQTVPTTCNQCAAGCAVHAGVRVQDGNVARFTAATNEATNEEWLCDKGRFGNAYVSSSERLTYPYIRKGNDLVPATWPEAFAVLAQGLKPVLEDGAASAVLIGESLCDEDAYAASKFARMVLGTNNVDHRLEGGLSAGALIRPNVTYDDMLGSDLVVLVGLDARQELPVLFLRLRIAATKKGLKIATVHQGDVSLSEYGDTHLRVLPGEEAAAATDMEATLRAASNATIVLGPRMHDAATIAAWQAVADATGARITWAPRRSGTYGALAAGAHPDLLPGWRTAADTADIAQAWGADLPSEPGKDVAGILNAAAAGELKALWLMGADVLDDVPDASLGYRALEAVPFVVVQDVQSTQLLNHADLVFPAAAFVERSGTLTDWEGRRQAVRGAVDPPGAARADYAILAECARYLGKPIGCRTLSDVQTELNGLLASAPVRGSEQPSSGASTPQKAQGEGLRLLTYRLLYDNGSRASKSDGIAALTPKAFVELNTQDAKQRGITDGQEVTVATAHGTLKLPAVVDGTLRPGVVFVPYNQPGGSARTLMAIDDPHPIVVVEA